MSKIKPDPLTATLIAELLQAVYPGHGVSITLHPSDSPTPPPETLPAVQIKPSTEPEQIDYSRGIHSGAVILVASTDPDEDWLLTRGAFASTSVARHSR